MSHEIVTSIFKIGKFITITICFFGEVFLGKASQKKEVSELVTRYPLLHLCKTTCADATPWP